jgi:hypothetical protein
VPNVAVHEVASPATTPITISQPEHIDRDEAASQVTGTKGTPTDIETGPVVDELGMESTMVVKDVP